MIPKKFKLKKNPQNLKNQGKPKFKKSLRSESLKKSQQLSIVFFAKKERKYAVILVLPLKEIRF